MAEYQPIPEPAQDHITYLQSRSFIVTVAYQVKLKLMRDDVEAYVAQWESVGEDSVTVPGQIDADLHGSEILLRDKIAQKFVAFNERELALNLESSHSELSDEKDDLFTVTLSSSRVIDFTVDTTPEANEDLSKSMAIRVERYRRGLATIVGSATTGLDLSQYHVSGDAGDAPYIRVLVEGNSPELADA